MSDAPPVRQRLSMDDIQMMLEDIARDDTGPDKFRAIRVLTAQKSQEAVLPEPMTETELVKRAARLMTGLGLGNAKLAFYQAFQHKKLFPQIDAQMNRLVAEDRMGKVKYPQTLRQLYKRYPELPKLPCPRGFPQRGSTLAKLEWIRLECDKIDLEKLQKRTNYVMKDILEATDEPKAAGGELAKEPGLDP